MIPSSEKNATNPNSVQPRAPPTPRSAAGIYVPNTSRKTLQWSSIRSTFFPVRLGGSAC